MNLREDDSSSIHVSYSIENRSRNENLNQYIDNLKAEIFQGQEVFKSHIHDLKVQAPYKSHGLICTLSKKCISLESLEILLRELQ